MPSCEVSYPSGATASFPNPLSVAELAGIVARSLAEDPTIARIAITGGEPMLQQRFIVAWLTAAPPAVPCLLETAATVAHGLEELLPCIDTVSADIKLPSNSGEGPQWERHRDFLSRCRDVDVYVKMPVSDDTLDDEVRFAARLAHETVPDAPLYLQPITDPDGGTWRIHSSRLLALHGDRRERGAGRARAAADAQAARDPLTAVSEATTATPSRQRERAWRHLEEEVFDLLVIGGGINGAAVARDAAMRGISVALVERGDFACGTSSRSSKLIHGGIRYLEQGDLALVLEACRERDLLRTRLAPHVVRAQRFVMPVYAGEALPIWQLRAGLVLYDALAGFRNVNNHRMLSVHEVRAHEPALLTDGLRGAALYYDCWTDDARLTIETVCTARSGGATVLNYCEVVALEKDSTGRLATARVHDHLGDRSARVRARWILNVTGPWLDRIRRLDDAGAPPRLKLTKGVHVVFDRAAVGNRDAIVIRSPEDNRVMFAIPWQDRTLVGTTDTTYSGDPARVVADRDDVDYILEATNHSFPRANLTSRRRDQHLRRAPTAGRAGRREGRVGHQSRGSDLREPLGTALARRRQAHHPPSRGRAHRRPRRHAARPRGRALSHRFDLAARRRRRSTGDSARSPRADSRRTSSLALRRDRRRGRCGRSERQPARRPLGRRTAATSSPKRSMRSSARWRCRSATS